MKRPMLFLIVMAAVTAAIGISARIGTAAVTEHLCSGPDCGVLVMSWGFATFTCFVVLLVGSLLWEQWPR